MPYNPKIHHRRSIRLKGYDYSQPGAYFITLCTHNRECLFGNIVDGEMVLNEYGILVKNEWLRTSEIRPNVIVDEFIIMPNHLHGIFIINDDGCGATCRGVSPYAPKPAPYINTPNTNIFKSPSKTIGAIIRGFKSITTKQINQLRNTHNKSVWQRNYYEHIVRNESSLNKIRKYITNNPMKWEMDKFFVKL